jgi:hypothetical protein
MGFGQGFGEREARRLHKGGDSLGGFGLDGTVKDRGSEFDNRDRGRERETIERSEAGIAADCLACLGITPDEDGAQTDAAAEGFGEKVLAFYTYYFGYLPAIASEGGAQFPDACVLATLYNADEARTIRSRWHGGILNLSRVTRS